MAARPNQPNRTLKLKLTLAQEAVKCDELEQQNRLAKWSKHTFQQVDKLVTPKSSIDSI